MYMNDPDNFKFRKVIKAGHKKCNMDFLTEHLRAYVFGNYTKISNTLQTPDGTPLDDVYLSIGKVRVTLIVNEDGIWLLQRRFVIYIVFCSNIGNKTFYSMIQSIEEVI